MNKTTPKNDKCRIHVKCEWNACAYNRCGFCQKDEIQLVNKTVYMNIDTSTNTLICKSFEWQ